MKFASKYREFVKEQNEELPVVQLKKLKKILKNCEMKNQVCDCHYHCPECDETFFPSLHKDMFEIVNYFNKGAQKLLEFHLASGLQKYVLFLKNKLQFGSRQVNLIKDGNHLAAYATVNAVAMQKILKKYDKVHCSMKGQEFRLEAQAKHMNLLKSPYLFELMAFHMNNLNENKEESKNNYLFPLLSDCLLHIDGEKPYLLVTLFDSISLNLELTCPVCLETVFDPVSLSCSHVFCYMCACSVASVTIVDGLKNADPRSKCPICRQVGVFEGAVHLDELSMLLSRSLPEYWGERFQRERKERIKQAKEHWEFQCRAFMGYR
ncbi:putative E3 ubiquitin-protein ligase BAH1-like 1 [Morus notabilis]|uniref:RING-type E3 ubiquitin transferase n=1 Tax=Morus notabilis TaxID=981085 RepID=W9SAS1_9ROSA|nr:probable E3 ubiquitin-protein ligase BAH1-like 1 [Morus notabilis]EXC19906.1 putative E3 ubiquitin-protein ligase BAH1-like 1 [Morus notabilis]